MTVLKVPLALASTHLVLAASSATLQSCPNPQLSCHNTSAVADTCCFNAPGGQLLQTQFWDTDPSEGPADSWTLHGLWPDHCNGQYDSYCSADRQYTNITQTLQSFGQTSLLAFMNTYWKNQNGAVKSFPSSYSHPGEGQSKVIDEGIPGTDESFWEHEWGKHGTCISTLDPSCYVNYVPQEEVVDFFNRTVSLFQTLPTYQWLADAGITPSATQNYSSSDVLAALAAQHGANVTIECTGDGELDEVYYFYNVAGSVQVGTFVPENPVGESSDCPDSLVYLPKQAS